MKHTYLGLVGLVLLGHLFCSNVLASSIDISAIQDRDISQSGDSRGFLEKKTNRTWLDIGETPSGFLTDISNTGKTTFDGWRIAEESEVLNLLISIFPHSNLGDIGGTWGGTDVDLPYFRKIAFTLGISDPLPTYGDLTELNDHTGWRANASFLGKDGKIKVFYLGRQGSDGYLPSVEVLGFSDMALESYIETFLVTPLFIAVNEPSPTLLLLLGIFILILKHISRLKKMSNLEIKVPIT